MISANGEDDDVTAVVIGAAVMVDPGTEDRPGVPRGREAEPGADPLPLEGTFVVAFDGMGGFIRISCTFIERSRLPEANKLVVHDREPTLES